MRSLAIAIGLIASGPAIAAPPTVGTTAPPTSITLGSGQTVSMDQLKGDVVVINFWMSDCKSCDAQLALLDEYYRQRRNVGMKVFVVPIEEMNDGPRRRAFKGMAVHPAYAFRSAMDPLYMAPTTYIIDRKGVIRYAADGTIGLDKLNEILVPLLREPQPL